MSAAVRLNGITKRFGRLVANDHIDLEVAPGAVHAVLGENGAGKTTLMNILYGLVSPDEGTIELRGERRVFKSPADAIAAGIGMVHQHFMIAPSLTVAENVLLGMAPRRFGLINSKANNRVVGEAARRFGFALDPSARAEDLSVGILQRIEIVKALIRGAQLLILDEPTAVLTPQEANELSGTLRTLAGQGTTIIIITHKLREVIAGCDRATVMRQGRVVGSVDVADTDERRLTEMMVGRVPVTAFHRHPTPSRPLLEVSDLTVRDDRHQDAVRNLSLSVAGGRVVGIAGVDGNGQTQLVEALTGLRRVHAGQIRLDETDITNRGPRRIRRAGIAHIPEDRLRRGVARTTSVHNNLLINVYRQRPHSRLGFLRPRASRAYAQDLISRFSIAVDGPSASLGGLSGGNIQKVVVARELAVAPRLVIAAQPTRGVDVGSIEFVHREIMSLRDAGVAVLLISAELDELRALSDVIHVMFEGAIIATFDPTADEYELGAAMGGGTSGQVTAGQDEAVA